MDASNSSTSPESKQSSAWGWVLVAVVALIWQGWLTLGLVGRDPGGWLDDQPILSGFHPQHLYLGTLGAQAWKSHGSSCAYDPSFQAAYPKTPVFNASRWGEMFLFLGGGGYRPAAYKIGLAVACLLVPVLILLAGWASGLSWGVGAGSVSAGLLVWWGPLGRHSLETGDLDVPLASLAVLAHVGLLISFHYRPSLFCWLGLVATGCLGWLCQPLLFPIALFLVLVYYMTVGTRHRSPIWHMALWLGEAAGLAANLPWLIDWVLYWWLRSPQPGSLALLPHRTLRTLWDAPLWGGSLDRALALVLLASAVAGVVLLNMYRHRAAARLLGLGAFVCFALAILGITWEPIGNMGTAAFLAPALWFAALPAAHAWCWLAAHLYQWGTLGRSALAGVAMALAAVGWFAMDPLMDLGHRAIRVEPLALGLGPQRQAIVKCLVDHTRADGRILWEDVAQCRRSPRWSALLPLLTGRAFIGGLDTEGLIEHARIGFLDQQLDGKPIAAWSDDELAEYCQRYNIGWIACWSPEVIERFQAWPGASQPIPMADGQVGYLFAVNTCQHTFALKGRAEVIQADSRRLTLGDVVPDQGVIVLSLHYQKGLRASPNRVIVEREPCGCDPIGFIRLRVASPVSRVTLTWER